MSFKDIINLCNTNHEFDSICRLNSTWQYLLYRDFDVIYNEENAYELYKKYRSALDYFSENFPIITKQALFSLVNIIPFEHWNIVRNLIQKYSDRTLTNEELISTYMDKMGWMPGLPINYPNYHEMIEELEDNCDKFDEFVFHPTVIFINKIPILLNYDYELAYLLATVTDCEEKFDTLTQNLTNLI